VQRGTQVRTLLVLWLFLLSAVGFMDRTNISIAGPAIQHELKLDDIHLGWVFSAFLLGYAAFQVVGGWLAYRYGPRRVLAAGVLWWGVFTALTTVANSHLGRVLLILILIRFALGAGEAVIYPASNQFVARWIPVPERGRANGWIFAGVGAGAGLSIPVLTWINSHYGWRASFGFSAVVGVLVGLGWYILARDAPEEHPRVSPDELAYIQATHTSRTVRGADVPVSWAAALCNRNVAALTLSYFAFGYVAWIFFSWFFIYMATVRGMNLKASALVSMIPFIAMTICCLGGGFISDRLSKKIGLRWGRGGIAVVSFALTALFLVIGAQVRGPYAASIILAGGAGALYLSQSSFWAVSADIAGVRSGVVSGVMNMGCQIGGAVTASLTPYIASRLGWIAAFVFAAALAAMGGAMWLLVDPGRRNESAPGTMPAEPQTASTALRAK
jgi:MFS transporter, ACS family, glucarate transporter